MIHAGIYYAAGSLKARLCVEGRELLYELCDKHDIPHRRITKVITATNQEEEPELERLHASAPGTALSCSPLTAAEVFALEPNITTVGGLLSPSTGIISAHGLMDYFHHAPSQAGAEVQTHCTVVGLERSSGYGITIEEGGHSSFTSEWVINAAGLEADTIASLAGIDVESAGYRIHYCKGSYFALPGSMSKLVAVWCIPSPRSILWESTQCWISAGD